MKKTILFLAFCFAFCLQSEAQQLVYQPKNPSFGGNPNYTAHLLNTANAQNNTEDPDRVDRFNLSRGSDLDNFTQSLNSQLLSQLSRSLVGAQFGEESLEDGTYQVGDFQVDVSNTLEGIVVTILDTGEGAQTQLIIPFF